MARPMNLLTKEQVEEFYTHGGMTTKDAAAALGVSEPTFLRYMKLFKVPARDSLGRTPEDAEAFRERDRLVREAVAKGEPVSAVAKRFQISRQRAYIIVGHVKKRSTNVR